MSLAAAVAAEPVPGRALHPELWDGVRRVVGRAPSAADLRAHGIEPLALAGTRKYAKLAQASVTAALSAPLLLRRIVAASDCRLLLFKGPEVAARYPHPAFRPFGDLDVLVDDADAVQRALLAAGFRPVGDERLYRDIHHLRPLHLEGFAFAVEVHSRPKWPEPGTPPSTGELFAAAVPSATGVDGVLAPAPAPHALLLAAHAWAHDPLGRLGSLVDVAAMLAEARPGDVERLASEWGIRRIWDATAAVVDALFFGGREPWPLRTWARHLPRARERTVLEAHAASWLAAFWSDAPGAAARACLAEVWTDLHPAHGEPARTKLRRVGLAFRHSLVRRSAHDAEVERRALDAPHPIFGRDE